MRVLENCSGSASPEMQAQIENLREAFSEDVTKPFQLKANLGLRSPSTESEPTPPRLLHAAQPVPTQSAAGWSHPRGAEE